MLTASVCTIGDEILIGQINDTNSGVIARELNKAGIKVVFMASVQDDEGEIQEKINFCRQISDIVITTGGLGPTKDDKTKNIIGKMYKSCGNYYHQGQLDVISGICKRRGFELSESNRSQALVPECCEVIVNNYGTAPGMIFKGGTIKSSSLPTLLILLPGVPYEMESILPEVIEYLKSIYPIEKIFHKNILTYGIPESKLSDMLCEWEESLPSCASLAYLPDPKTGVKLRISIYGEQKNIADAIISKALSSLYLILRDKIYGEDEETFESVVSKLLTSRTATLAVSESCTGGRLASRLTSLPGASLFFKGSVTAYDNKIKNSLLNVPVQIIEKYGAVSKECAALMAEGTRNVFGSDFSVAITGIAGPDGGSEEKPVGTVWIAVSGKKETISRKFSFTGMREQIIERSSSQSLDLLRLFIDNKII